MDLKYYAKKYINISNKPQKNRKYEKINRFLYQNDVVLDIGCASGLFYEARKHKNIKYYGIDYNETMVNHCKKKGLNVKKCNISLELLPYEDNTFDFVYCSHVLEHLLANEQIKLFSEIKRILKKNGRLLLFSPTPYHRYFRDDPTHQRAITHGSLEHLAKDFGFKIIEVKYSNTRYFPQVLQTYLRLPLLRRFLREVYLVAKK